MAKAYLYGNGGVAETPNLLFNTTAINEGYAVSNVTNNHSNGILDFPCTISSTEPIPENNGHIWICTDKVSVDADIYVREVIDAGIPNNSVILLTDTTKAHIDIWSTNRHFLHLSTAPTESEISWLAGSNNCFTKLPIPIAYVKVDGIVYLETAYMWNGESWITASNADKYIIGPNIRPDHSVYLPYMYSWSERQITPKPLGINAYGYYALGYSKNGQFIAYAGREGAINIYIKNGESVKLFQTLSGIKNPIDEYSRHVAFSDDGTKMVLITPHDTSEGSIGDKLLSYTLNTEGTSFILNSSLPLTSRAYREINVKGNFDLSVVIVSYNNGSSYTNWDIYSGSASTGYTKISPGNDLSTRVNVSISPNGKYMVLLTLRTSGFDGKAFYYDNGVLKTSNIYNTFYYKQYQPISITNDGIVIFQINNTLLGQFKINDNGTTSTINMVYIGDGGTNRVISGIVCDNKESSYIITRENDAIKLYKVIFNGEYISSLSFLTSLDILHNSLTSLNNYDILGV